LKGYTLQSEAYNGLDDKLGGNVMLDVRRKLVGNSNPGRFNPRKKRESWLPVRYKTKWGAKPMGKQ